MKVRLPEEWVEKGSVFLEEAERNYRLGRHCSPASRRSRLPNSTSRRCWSR